MQPPLTVTSLHSFINKNIPGISSKPAHPIRPHAPFFAGQLLVPEKSSLFL
jgi:hypothetical protein